MAKFLLSAGQPHGFNCYLTSAIHVRKTPQEKELVLLSIYDVPHCARCFNRFLFTPHDTVRQGALTVPIWQMRKLKAEEAELWEVRRHVARQWCNWIWNPDHGGFQTLAV